MSRFAKSLCQSLIVVVTFLSLSPAHADKDMSRLRSYPVWAAVSSCLAVVSGCENATFGISREINRKEVCKKGRLPESCHLVNKAVDVHGSEACMDNLARCLSVSPTPVLYCYKDWGVIGPLAGCDAGAHQDHVHVQTWGGCHREARQLLKQKGIVCDKE